ncbi:MAG TPA: alpha/beta hydrolase [Vicinamibacterales bacterium]|nr:alpha/beta hydrolase [Vicinamibacterales bacterium]
MSPRLRVLTVPGYTGSGPSHWQTLWERQHPDYVRVEQDDWDHPDCGRWVAALDARVREAEGACLLIAHSLGCMTVAHWALRTGGRGAAAAFLVAPADADRPDTPYHRAGFSPIPLAPLPFPSLVVASRNDPVITFERAATLARAWGGALHDAGYAGHLATKDGYGPWPEGERLLAALVSALEEERPSDVRPR